MRILVAEDHPSIARSIAAGLREDGFAVDMSFDGKEASDLASSVSYDCIILDVNLPTMDGFSILTALREKAINMPVLFLTARDGVEDRIKGLNLGADDYLVKPFNFEELLARVRAMLRRLHNQRTTVITIGDLTIDTVSRAVSRGGHSIRLSAREFMLLEYLAHRVGHIVTREEIQRHVYDMNDEVNSNVVDVYIAYLRAKIDKDHAVKLIHTRRGLGYMLAEEP